MASLVDVPLAEVVLFIGDFQGVDNILELSGNSRYEFKPPADGNTSWLGERHKDLLSGPTLCLTFGQHIHSPEGWVCGSATDIDRADVQIAPDNSGGVSRRHFLVDIDPLSRKPRLKVLGQLLRVIPRDTSPIVRLKGQSVEIVEPVIVDLGKVSFQAWQPTLVTAAQKRTYDQRARQFGHDAVAAMPRYFPSLDSGIPTVSSAMRVGKEGSVYLYKGNVGKGLYVAKEPYFKAADDFSKIQHKWEEVRHEFEQLTKLQHPHVVKVYDVASSKDKQEPPWLIMEYIPDTIAPTELDQTSATVMATQILGALAHIHAYGIVHGDVKPDNILVRHDATLIAKLADFGLAQQYVERNLHDLVGTPLYWAPELRNATIQYTHMTDMFSFGLVLLQCFSSWDPSSDSQARFMLDRHSHCSWMREHIVPLVQKGTPQHLRPLLRGLLRRQPEDRWSALQCLRWLSAANEHSSTYVTSGTLVLPHVGEDDNDDSEAIETRVIGTSGGAEDLGLIAATKKDPLPERQKRPASSSFESGVRPGKNRSLTIRGKTQGDTSETVATLSCDALLVGRQSAASPANPTSPSEAPTPCPEEPLSETQTGGETADGDNLGFEQDWDADSSEEEVEA